MTSRWIPVRRAFIFLGTILSIGCAATALAATAPSVVGDWQATMKTPNGSLHLILHISQNQEGRLAGTMDSPDQNTTGIQISALSFNEPDLHFVIDTIAASYDAKLSKDKADLTGEWKFNGNSMPLNFKRVVK